MENYKNFFSDSYADEVFMEGDNVHMHKKYGDNLVFKFIDMGWKKEVLENIKESIQIEAFPEIIFLSKYVGDYNIKLKKIKNFIIDGDKTKISVRFRGREILNSNLGLELLNRIKDDLSDVAQVDQEPSLEGRQLLMVLSKVKKK